MKKQFLSLFSAAVLAGGALTGCDIENVTKVPTAEMTVTASMTSADITLKTENLTEYAYSVSTEGEAGTDAAVLFAKGTVGTLTDGDNTFTVSGLEGNTKYSVSVAFKVSDSEFYQDVLSAEFTTTDYEQTLTHIKSTYDGFSLHFKMPEEIKKAGHVVRYTLTDIATYNSTKMGWFASTDAESLEANGQVYWDGDATLTINNDNIYLLDENGNPVMDEWTEEPVLVHLPIVPGEPIVFLAGEFQWGESLYGWGEGYYTPLFDMEGYSASMGGGDDWGLLAEEPVFDEDKFWTGYHERIYFQATQPELLAAKIDVDIQPTATGGTIRLTPEEGVYQYCYYVIDDATYSEMLLPLLGGDESLLQWYITSIQGMYSGCASGMGAAEIALEEVSYIEPEMKYHFLLTSMGNEEGTTQNFQHIEFETPAKSMKAPEVVVTALKPEEVSPYTVYFNIKCPTKNAVGGQYAANYSREFEMLLNNQNFMYSYNDIVAQGNRFTADELEAVNSDEGYTVAFPSVPNETTRLAVVLYNEEDTGNTIEGTDSPAVAEVASDKEPDAARVESPLFTTLPGDWTMTANVTKRDYETGNNVDAGSRSCKVTIASGVEYPEKLTDDIYALYPNMTKEQVDALYDEFKEEAGIFNSWLRGQNRLLCLGFGFEDSPSHLTYQSAYDLFTSTTYSGYDNRSLFWEFGPKWYLEIAADGTVSAPFNYYTMYPMSGWNGKYVYLCGNGPEGVLLSNNGETIAFPGTVSSDNSTVTISPISNNGNDYYPQAGAYNYGYMFMTDCFTASPLTLTKGWTEPETTVSAASKSVKKVSAPVVSSDHDAIPLLRKTQLKALREYKKISYKVLSKDEIKANLTNAKRR